MSTNREDPGYATFPAPCYFLLLQLKYLLQYFILEYPQSIFINSSQR